MIKKRFYNVILLVYILISTVVYATEIDKCSFSNGLSVFNDSGTISLGECQTHLHLNGSNKLGVLNENLSVQGNCFNQCDGARCEGSGEFAQKIELPEFVYSVQSSGWQTIQNSTDTITADANHITVQTNGNFNVSIDNTLINDIASLTIQNNSDFRFNYNGNTPYVIKTLNLNSGNTHTITFEPGSYFIENFNHQAGTHIVVDGEGDGSGQVRLYVKNNLQINGGYTKVNYDSSASGYEQNSAALLLASYDKSISVQANVDIAALVYAPNGDASINAGPMNFSGAITANNIWFQNRVKFWSNSAGECGSDTTQRPPIADDQNLTINEDTSLSIHLTTSSLSEDINYLLVSEPVHGKLSGIFPNLVYTPRINYFGADTFTFKVDENGLESEVATIKIDVLPVNDIPIAYAQQLTLQEDSSKIVMLSGVDIDSDELSFNIVTQPKHGVLSGSLPNIFYIPQANYYGEDSFTFNANDGEANSSIAQITLNVTSVNDAPVGVDDVVSVNEDESFMIDVLANDTDIDGTLDTSTLSIVKQTNNATLSVDADGKILYTPNINYFGEDSFQYTIKDNNNSISNVVNVSIKVNSINDLPIANTQHITLDEDTSASIILNATDIDDTNLSYIVLNEPSNGTLSGIAPNLTYTPKANFYGEDSFAFKVNDGESNSSIANIYLTVLSINDEPIEIDDNITNNIPVANSQNLISIASQEKNILLSGYDEDGDELSYQIMQQSSNGTLSGLAPNISYTPNNAFEGVDCFTFKVNDGIEDSEEAVVTISSYPKYSINSIYPDGTVSIEELSFHLSTQDATYMQRLIGYNNDGNLKENNLLYDIYSQLDSSGYGAIYVTIKNNQPNDLNNIHISFLADLSIEENQNTFFNEYGEYIGMDTGLEGIKADTWQIDEPDYLQGQIIQNAKNAELSQMNHINIIKKDDVAMALGFKIDSFKQNDILSFKIILSDENIGGLKQIDHDTNTSVYYNIIMNEITTSSCSMN